MAGSPAVVKLAPVEAAGRHQPLQLECQLGHDRHQVRRVAGKVGKPVQCIAPDQLFDRRFMVIDGDHDMAVVERPVPAVASHHQQGSGLLAPYIATCSLARRQRRHQSFGKRCARLLECPNHMLDDIIAGKAVPECDATTARSTTRPSVPPMQVRSRVSGDNALLIDQCELPRVAQTVVIE